jgi:hypothetical protein
MTNSPGAEFRPAGMTPEQLASESGTALPERQALSVPVLNVDANLDLNLDLAAAVDAALAANANAGAPVDASASASVLSPDSVSSGTSAQEVAIQQTLDGQADASAPQTAHIDQGDTATPTDD